MFAPNPKNSMYLMLYLLYVSKSLGRRRMYLNLAYLNLCV
jgi:hypothetical protein